MFANSRTISSAQSDIHEHLATLVERHLAEPFRKPIGAPSQHAFDAAIDVAAGGQRAADSRCGLRCRGKHVASRHGISGSLCHRCGSIEKAPDGR
jgi:hypothetical protein